MTLQFDPDLVRDQFSLTQFRHLIAKDVWRISNWHIFALIETKLAYHLWYSWELNSSKWYVSFFVGYISLLSTTSVIYSASSCSKWASETLQCEFDFIFWSSARSRCIALLMSFNPWPFAQGDIEEKLGDFVRRQWKQLHCRLLYTCNLFWPSLLSRVYVKQLKGHQLMGYASAGAQRYVVFELFWYKSDFPWHFWPSRVCLRCLGTDHVCMTYMYHCQFPLSWYFFKNQVVKKWLHFGLTKILKNAGLLRNRHWFLNVCSAFCVCSSRYHGLVCGL